jgi:hypothetical protein
MLTVYGDLDSGNVYKVRLLLAQLGIAYRRVDTTQNRGEPATAGGADEGRAQPGGQVSTSKAASGVAVAGGGGRWFR